VGIIKKYWFILGLLVVCGATLFDTTETISGVGRWLKLHHGPDAVIVLIFFFSGMVLNARQIRDGLMDIKGILTALAIIFIASPILAMLLGRVPVETGIAIGIFLVAVMPTTLSSGVVMTGASGGNMAHALVITILANGLAVFTIPVILSFLLTLIGGATVVTINKLAIMIKIGALVLLPLGVGLLIKLYATSLVERFTSTLQIFNQCLVLGIVWMATSLARDTIITSDGRIGIILLLVFFFHGTLLAVAGILIAFLKINKGKRESVVFMGCQKTLPLSVVLQVSLFPQYGLALVVCVLHHIVYLLMDGYLVGKLKD
jgi:sodium/bile acid cotransporter 7